VTLLFFDLEGRHLRGQRRVAGVGGDLFEALDDAEVLLVGLRLLRRSLRVEIRAVATAGAIGVLLGLARHFFFGGLLGRKHGIGLRLDLRFFGGGEAGGVGEGRTGGGEGEGGGDEQVRGLQGCHRFLQQRRDRWLRPLRRSTMWRR